MKQPNPTAEDGLQSNVQLLQQFWNRSTFHDMRIESIRRLNGRVVVNLNDYFLVLVGVKRYVEKFDDPETVWLYHSLEINGSVATLKVEAELGEFEASFTNLRLIDRRDLKVLIPPVDR